MSLKINCRFIDPTNCDVEEPPAKRAKMDDGVCVPVALAVPIPLPDGVICVPVASTILIPPNVDLLPEGADTSNLRTLVLRRCFLGTALEHCLQAGLKGRWREVLDAQRDVDALIDGCVGFDLIEAFPNLKMS